MRTQKIPLEHREGPQLNCIQGRCCKACKACSKKGAQLEIFSFYSDIGPAWGWGWGKPLKETPKTGLNALTNYQEKLILATSVGANSGLSYLEFNSTWKETLVFSSWKLEKIGGTDCPPRSISSERRPSAAKRQPGSAHLSHLCSGSTLEPNTLPPPVTMNCRSHQGGPLAWHSVPPHRPASICPTMLSVQHPQAFPSTSLTSFPFSRPLGLACPELSISVSALPPSSLCPP